MAFNLLSLLQAAAGVPVEEEATEVTVTGTPKKMPAPEADPAPPPMSNRSYLEEAQAAREGAPARKGMFGTKGTLRDILGVVSDAFLVQSGNRPQYQSARDAERQADAFSGFTANPQAALERLAATPGGEDIAMKLYQSIEDNKLRQAQMDSMSANRQSQMSDRAFENREKGLNRLSRWVRGGLPHAQILAAAKQYGITPEELLELGVSENMTPEQRSQFASGDLTVNQQEQLPFRREQLDIARDNAQSNRIRATRPPAPRAAPQPTAAGMAAPLIQKLQRGGKLTPNETEVLNRLGFNPNRGQGRQKRTPPPLPPGFKIK